MTCLAPDTGRKNGWGSPALPAAFGRMQGLEKPGGLEQGGKGPAACLSKRTEHVASCIAYHTARDCAAFLSTVAYLHQMPAAAARFSGCLRTNARAGEARRPRTRRKRTCCMPVKAHRACCLLYRIPHSPGLRCLPFYGSVLASNAGGSRPLCRWFKPNAFPKPTAGFHRHQRGKRFPPHHGDSGGVPSASLALQPINGKRLRIRNPSKNEARKPFFCEWFLSVIITPSFFIIPC